MYCIWCPKTFGLAVKFVIKFHLGQALRNVCLALLLRGSLGGSVGPVHENGLSDGQKHQITEMSNEFCQFARRKNNPKKAGSVLG